MAHGTPQTEHDTDESWAETTAREGLSTTDVKNIAEAVAAIFRLPEATPLTSSHGDTSRIGTALGM